MNLLPPNEAIESARSIFEELKDELQSWMDSLPENLQSGSKADALEAAIGQLDSACDLLVEAPEEELDGIQEGEIPKKPSRAKRCNAAIETLSSAVEVARSKADSLRTETDPETKTEREAKADEWEEWADEIESAQQEAEGVEFPGMFG